MLSHLKSVTINYSLYRGYSILDDVTYSISDESQTKVPSAEKEVTHVSCVCTQSCSVFKS